MANTRAATFSAKIRTLSDFQSRLSTNQQPPSNAEIITTLRYFQQTLIGFVKDFPAGQVQFVQKFSSDPARWNLYPNLNYSGLFYAVVGLLDVFPLIPSGHVAVGEAVLDTLKALMVFLDRDAIEQMPILVASQLGVLPAELDKQIVHLLADVVLPFALSPDTFCRLSIPAVFMLVFQHNDLALHTWILEAAMAYSDDVYADVLAVIARGTSEARVAAANLLFHYAPFSNPQILHRKTIQYKVHGWNTVPCQYSTCSEKGPSVKRCYDPVLCADGADTSPPVFLCRKCADNVAAEKRLAMDLLLQPMPSGQATCQNKTCPGRSRLAAGVCVSAPCVLHNNNVPLRLCQDCLVSLHEEGSEHRRQLAVKQVWGEELHWTVVEAVVKLLRETATHEATEAEGKRPKWLRQLEAGNSVGKDIDKMADERRMLSRFGVWLMAALCPPTPEAEPRAVAYMMSTLFQWFATTALLPNDSMGASLEQLKTDFVCEWINTAIQNHGEVFIETLSPVDGDDFGSAVDQTKHGLSKLLALMPYDVISLETWSAVMPRWLQLITVHGNDDNMGELKILLCKIFEPDLCPLPFETVKVFEFISNRLLADSYEEVLDGLHWLHQLSRLEICIPMPLLLDAFNACLQKLPQLEPPPVKGDLADDEVALHVVLVDLLVLQLRVNDIAVHEVSALSERLFECLARLLAAPMHAGEHCCSSPEADGFADCVPCQQAVFLYQMLTNLTESVSPKQEIKIVATEDDPVYPDEASTTASHRTSCVLSPQTGPGSKASPQNPLPGDVPSEMHAVRTATVEEESVEFVGILPQEEVCEEMVQAVTLTDTDCGRETYHVITSTMVEGMKSNLSDRAPRLPPSDFWDTSVGRFRFSFDQLPPQLKLIHALLTNIDGEEDPDAQYFILQTLKYLCLHCESLTNARREHRGFLVWTLEHMMVPKLWRLLRSDYIQVGDLAVLLLMHAITFPAGEERFWRLVHEEFTDDNWQLRFDAVGRAYVIAHLMKPAPVKANKVVQTSLSGVFFHLVVSVHDPDATVSQRALCALRALPGHTLKLMCTCFESQFDSCIIDRPILINAINTMTSQAPDEATLAWDFFIQRFETLVLESQLSSQTEDNMFVQDLMHSDPMSELYQRKVARARKALEDSQTARSISRQLGDRAMPHQLLRKPSDSATPLVPGAEIRSPTSVVSPSYNSGGYGRLREFTDEESNLCLLFNRVVDMDNPERHTVYLTISLFVTFLCNKKNSPTDEKANAKKQSVLFRHFNTLLGYSNTEKCFTIPPARLRKSAVCNAFISGLPEILDTNLIIGNQLLPTTVQLLQHLPSPQKLASDQHSSDYSLKLLPIHLRHLWLHSLILILYKYRFDQMPISDGVMRLINIVIKTLEGQAHECARDSDVQPELDCWSDISSESEEEEEEEEVRPSSPDRPDLHRPESLTVRTHSVASKPDDEEPRRKRTVERGEIRKKSSCVSVSGNEKKKKKKRGSPQPVDLRCTLCGEVRECFDEESISLCLVAASAFLRREPAMAAPILFRILHTVTRIVDEPLYPWHDAEMFVPGNCRSVAKQLLRVSLHQLSTSGICLQLFDSPIPKGDAFWSVVCRSLLDFTELNPVFFIQLLLEDMVEQFPAKLNTILGNLAVYIVEVPSDTYITHWSAVTAHMENFFRRYHTQLLSEGSVRPRRREVEAAITVLAHVMKVQNFSAFKSSVSLVESFSKWLAETLHSCALPLRPLLQIGTACNRALIRERDKQCVSRSCVAELVQAVKFKCHMPEQNLLTLANLVLQDAGEDVSLPSEDDDQWNTAAGEAARPFLFELLDFIADLHVLSRLKRETSSSDLVGGDLKVALAEIIAVEMSRSNARDCRSVIRFIPWLMSPPSVTQAPPSAFADSVTNVRILSWLLLGALHANQNCLPVPIECSQHMADYIHFVLAGFADQSKQSVVHMSALFHAFHLCQLWTVYCERAAGSCSSSFAHVRHFWARVTPAILQLLSHSKVLADMVNLHFLNTIQALQQVNSALLCQLYAMWAPILTAYHQQVPNQLRLKLDSGESQPSLSKPELKSWLKRVRYKISQVELQTAAASPFYNV